MTECKAVLTIKIPGFLLSYVLDMNSKAMNVQNVRVPELVDEDKTLSQVQWAG